MNDKIKLDFWTYHDVTHYAIMWDAKFKAVSSLTVCADMINKPHEDYPQRVDRTAEIIKFMIEGFAEVKSAAITPRVVRQVHQMLYELDDDNHKQYVNAGGIESRGDVDAEIIRDMLCMK